MPSAEPSNLTAPAANGNTKKSKKSKKMKELNGSGGERMDVDTTDTTTTPAAENVKNGDKEDKKLRKEKKKAKKEKERREREAAEEAGSGDIEEEEDRIAKKKEKKEKKKQQKEAQKKFEEAEEKEKTSDSQETNKELERKKRKEEKKAKKDKKRKRDAEPDTTEPAVKKQKSLDSGSYTYSQLQSLTDLPQSEIDAFLNTHTTTITGGIATTAPLRPIISFAHLPPTPLLAHNPFGSFKTPTPIQSASWPYTLSGRDVVGVAETGSGKTLAFALPCVYRVLKQKSTKGIKAAIVAPTRELAMQTHEQVSQLANHAGVSCVCIYGGASKDEQRRLLKKNPDIVVATPGRLRDFMNEGSCNLGNVQFAVLDEADRMLDKGFEDDIKKILETMPARGERQTLMFTATWPRSVQALAATMMLDPVKITIGSPQCSDGDGANSLQANIRISQSVEVMESTDKESRLLRLIQQEQRGAAKGDLHRIIVFCLYKKEAARVESFLSRNRVKVAGIHGDMNQSNRTAALAAFKSGNVTVLVATDVAARGLDIPEVKLVINCTFPLTIEDYVHRIGRTGRAGKSGSAITFFTKQDKGLSGALVNVLRASNQPIPEDLLKFGTTVKKKVHPIYGAFYREPAAEPSDVPAKIVFDD